MILQVRLSLIPRPLETHLHPSPHPIPKVPPAFVRPDPLQESHDCLPHNPLVVEESQADVEQPGLGHGRQFEQL